MNALAAPFLYTMPTQLEAFACFSRLIERWLPEYVQTDLRGVHRGVEVGPQTNIAPGLTCRSWIGVYGLLTPSSTNTSWEGDWKPTSMLLLVGADTSHVH